MTAVAAAAFLSVAAGCLVTAGSSTQESGVRVSRNTLAQIELGKTTEQWLVAVLGPPTARSPVADRVNVEILRYNHAVSKSGHGTVFLIFSGHSDKSQASSAFFEVSDGVITRYWTEP
jgi:hypothetical protein